MTEEQAKQYVAQLRSAPAEQVVTEILSGLLNAAQVKLGRRDARLLIDLSAVVLEQARRYVSTELATQVEQVLSQLRLGQVRAEEAAAAGEPAAEPNDLPETPAPPAGGTGAPATAPAAPAAPSQPSPASRLWVPGRDF